MMNISIPSCDDVIIICCDVNVSTGRQDELVMYIIMSYPAEILI